jgi:predicted dehydrogenase/threonine dehydrogenase-like Zn-dependent dehydrogenase
MKQLLVKDGAVRVAEVPAPLVSPKNVLVRVLYSCVSAGTEMANVRMSGLPLYRRALKQPEHVRKVLEMMRDQGVKHTLNRVMGILEAGTPTGYSAAGEVVEVGSQVEGFARGDRVACAGAGIANHAEMIDVPVNLAVRIPDDVATLQASTVTLGAIALQGVRRCNPTLGETVVVVGLGVLGQLTAQMLQASGCRVIGVDVNPRRLALAHDNGTPVGLDPAAEDYVAQVHRITGGVGADAAIVTAAGASDEIISAALRACRRKGRVVLVGDVGLHLRRSDMYVKELDFLISTSYGPGRYDPYYEEGGQDYPIGYVRWTENRNMDAYLRMIGSGQVRLGNLYKTPHPIERATDAYAALKAGADEQLLAILEYPVQPAPPVRRIDLQEARPIAAGKVGVALVGAGNFAQGMHLPNLLKLRSSFELRGVVSRTGANAMAAAKRYGGAYATTEIEQVLQDPNVQLAIIATRHNLHAGQALQFLRAGKHVLVEKPLALQESELREIEAFYAQAGANAPVLMTGFNRRFAPAITNLVAALRGRSSPMIVNYRMNAGAIPAEHWVHGEEGGGRNIGEACHIYDLFAALTGSTPQQVTALAIDPISGWKRNDNFVATIRYADGSVCTLTYTALGSKSFPKERMDVFCDGKIYVLDDYKSLRAHGARQGEWSAKAQQKGQLEELEALAQSISRGGPWPISLADQLATTRVSFEVERQLR